MLAGSVFTDLVARAPVVVPAFLARSVFTHLAVRAPVVVPALLASFVFTHPVVEAVIVDAAFPRVFHALFRFTRESIRTMVVRLAVFPRWMGALPTTVADVLRCAVTVISTRCSAGTWRPFGGVGCSVAPETFVFRMDGSVVHERVVDVALPCRRVGAGASTIAFVACPRFVVTRARRAGRDIGPGRW